MEELTIEQDVMLGHPIWAGELLTEIANYSDPAVQCAVVEGRRGGVREQAEILREQAEAQLIWADGQTADLLDDSTLRAQENFLSSLLMALEEGKNTTGTAQVIERYMEQLSLDEVRFPENRAPTTERAPDNIESDKVALISLKLASEGRHIKKGLSLGALKQRLIQKVAQELIDGEKIITQSRTAALEVPAARYIQAVSGKKIVPWTRQRKIVKQALKADKHKQRTSEAVARAYAGLFDKEELEKAASELLQKRRTHCPNRE